MSLHCFADFLLDSFADFFALSQRFILLKKKSIAYVQDELFSGLKLTNLGKIYSYASQNLP
jgi:hypothetical protein